MMKMRRYLRGSGRVLAFVFVASVIWLLFDMAALRLSINDANSQLLKERVMREMESLKQQSRATQLLKRGFKHPLQRVDLAVTAAGRGPLNPGIKLAEVYRQGGNRLEQRSGAKKTFEHQRGSLSKTQQEGYVLSEHRDGARAQDVTPKQDVAKKQAVNLDVKRAKVEKSTLIEGFDKLRLPVASNVTKMSFGIQEKKQELIGAARKELLSEGGVGQDKGEPRAGEKAMAGIKQGHVGAEGTHPGQITLKASNKDVSGMQVNNKTAEKHAKAIVKSDAAGETPKPAVRAKLNATAVRKPGVHKVLSLDLTLAPRDAGAVGQFGQAALVASNEKAEVRKRWDEGFFNVYLSDQIPVDRAIPDTRPET